MGLDLEAIGAQLQQGITEFMSRLPALLLAFLVFLLFLWLAGRLSSAVKSIVGNHGRSANAATVSALISRWAIIVLGVLVALSIALPTFKAADLIQLLGISSVAIGFAFRDIFQNFLAGLIILLTDAFEIGDQIVVESEKLEGTVTDIQTRATTILTYDDLKIIIPNATLFTNPVTINTASEKRRSEQVVGIGYDSDIDEAAALITEAILQIEGVLAVPPPDVLVDALADSSINLKVRWWTDAQRRHVIKTKSAVLRQIKYTLDEHGIDIPFPVRTLYVKEIAIPENAKSNGR